MSYSEPTIQDCLINIEYTLTAILEELRKLTIGVKYQLSNNIQNSEDKK